ncbi:Transposable element Tc1 transposase, partial [Anthophora retusa]
MGRAVHITAEQRKEIVRLRNERMTFRQIAEHMGISVHASHTAVKHVEKLDTFENKIRASRPRKTTPRMDPVIHRLSEKDRHRTAVDIHSEILATSDLKIGVHTVRRRLNEFGLMGRVARKKPLISKKNRKERLTFVKEHIKWTREQWGKVVFTDESKFNRVGSDGKSYVRRRVGEEFDPKCIKSTIKGGGGAVMIWGAMTINGVGPIASHSGEDWIFQADNDPKHTSRKAKQFLQDNNVNVMKWPAQSPDLNPIEMLWNDVGRAVSTQKPSNLNDLFDIIHKAWNDIDINRCIRLIESMPRRCAEVIKMKGKATRYRTESVHCEQSSKQDVYKSAPKINITDTYAPNKC